MAFPTIPTVAAGQVISGNQLDSNTGRTFPAFSGLTGIANGDLLIAIIVSHGSGSTSNIFSAWSNGFTEFHDSGGTNEMCVGMAYKWTTGSETGSLSVTQATPAGDASMYILAIPGAHASTPPEAGSRAVGTTAAANPAAFDPAGWAAEDTLWISFVGSGMTSGTGSWTATGTTAPTNYTDRDDTNASDTSTAGDCEAAISFRQLNAASEDVGTAGVDTSNARNVAVVVAVRPAPAAVSLDAGQNTVTVTAPDIPAVNLTMPQTTNTVTISAPDASIPEPPLAAGQNTVTVTAPTANLAIDYALAAGQNTVTSTAPIATMLVGTTSAKNWKTYSEDFTTVDWDPLNATVTANNDVAPDGTTTAERWTENTANSTHTMQLWSVPGLPNKEYFNFSLFVKPQGRTYIAIQFGDYGTSNYLLEGYFTLSGAGTAVLGGNDNGKGDHYAVIEQAPNGYYRCSVAGWLRDAGSQDVFAVILVGDTPGVPSSFDGYTGDGSSGLSFWGAQVETTTSRTIYTKTFASAVENTILTFGGVQVAITAPTAVIDQNLLSAGQNTVTITAPDATIDAPAGGTTLAAGQNTITISAPDQSQLVETTLSAGQNTITVSAPDVPAVVLTIPQTANTITVTAPDATLATGGSPATLDAGQNTITISAPDQSQLVETTLAAGQNVMTLSAPDQSQLVETTVAAGQNTVTSTAPTADAVPGNVDLAAGQNTITLTAGNAEVIQAGSLLAEANIITVTAPSIPAVHLTMPQSESIITVSAPEETILAEITLAAGQNTITVSAPTATMIVDSVVSAGQSTMTVTAPTALLISLDQILTASANTVTVSLPLVVAVHRSLVVETNTMTVEAPVADIAVTFDSILTTGSAILTVGVSTFTVQPQYSGDVALRETAILKITQHETMKV